MQVTIDPTVIFELRDKTLLVRVDALDLDEFMSSMWGKAKEIPKLDGGQPVLGEDGKPVMVKTLTYLEIEDGVRAFLKSQGCTADDLKRSELRGIWENAGDVWAKKNESWKKQAADSPTSQPAMDPRFAD